MQKKALITIGVLLLIVVSLVVFFKNKQSAPAPTPSAEPTVNLPVNTIPVSERPYVLLTPSNNGRSLELYLDRALTKELVEYELVYNAAGKQEGVFGRLNLDTETQPITKSLLLGSQSAGGKITYHEGITGGSLTLTYGETKLKEQFNFLRFDIDEPSVSSQDVRFTVDFGAKAMPKDTVIVTMKSFGLPTDLPEGKELIAGPYAYLTGTVKGDVVVSIKLPAGEHVNPTIYEYNLAKDTFLPLKTTLSEDEVSATAANGSTYLVTADK